jgi:DNA-binding transcriptional regulator YhcF (GntR family)
MTALESPYLQVAQQSKQAMRLGMLSVGDQPVINPNIVLKAYRELEQEELVGSRPG